LRQTRMIAVFVNCSLTWNYRQVIRISPLRPERFLRNRHKWYDRISVDSVSCAK
jgi:hypothetical protein